MPSSDPSPLPQTKGTGSAPPKEIPSNQNKVEQAASPIATLSSQSDPIPHYIMTAICGGGAAYAYNNLRNPRAAAIAGGFGALYFTAARLLANGNTQLGYDLGTATSLGLLATVGTRAYHTGESYSVAMASAGAISSVANGIKSYQERTGKPHEMRTKGH